MENASRKARNRNNLLQNHGATLLVVLSCAALVEFGCSSALITYPYRAITNNCNCEEYRVSDANVEYICRTHYRMDAGIVTTIEIEFTNTSHTDTLTFDHSAVKISSRNVAYQYNNKFLPIPLSTILPRRTDHVMMSGREVTGVEDWHKIAGEQLTITVKGIRLAMKELPQQAVTFVPKNPKLGKE